MHVMSAPIHTIVQLKTCHSVPLGVGIISEGPIAIAHSALTRYHTQILKNSSRKLQRLLQRASRMPSPLPPRGVLVFSCLYVAGGGHCWPGTDPCSR